MQVVRALLDAVAQAGVPRSTFLQAARLEPAWLQGSDGRFPRSGLYGLFSLALELTADPAFGLHSIERMATDALNPVSALVIHAATLREALSSIQEFRCLLGDEATFRVCEVGDKVRVKVDSARDQPLNVRRYMTEVSLAGLYRTIRRFRANVQVDYVAFEYGAPPYAREYGRIFEGRARFEQEFTGICFGKELMNAASPHPDAGLHQALRAFARSRVLLLNDRLPYAERVHQFLIWQQPPRVMTMEVVARALGVSVRSLRRYLSAEGKSFASLVSGAQAVIAKTCLLDQRRTIMETAFELGFADNTSFHRAFKRWTGLTPVEYRRQHAVETPESTAAP